MARPKAFYEMNIEVGDVLRWKKKSGVDVSRLVLDIKGDFIYAADISFDKYAYPSHYNLRFFTVERQKSPKQQPTMITKEMEAVDIKNTIPESKKLIAFKEKFRSITTELKAVLKEAKK